MDVFKDFLPAIKVTGENIIESEQDEKDYLPHLVNLELSFHSDCIMLSNMMNMNHHLDKKLQFDFLLNTVRKYKRPHRWIKKDKTLEDIETLIEYYGYSREKAKDVLPLLTRDQLDDIKIRTLKGGLKNE